MLDGLEDSGRRLDTIVADGLRCIDEAVEGVIDEACLVDINLDEMKNTLDRMISGDTYHGRYNAQLRADQRELNARMTRMANNALLQNAGGLHGIGDQSTQGSPLYQLGAAYRNAFGGM
jgi:hypothetical protein